jgi:hypothetical protein
MRLSGRAFINLQGCARSSGVRAFISPKLKKCMISLFTWMRAQVAVVIP